MEAKITVGIGGLSRGRNLLKPMLNNGRLLATRFSLAHHSMIFHNNPSTDWNWEHFDTREFTFLHCQREKMLEVSWRGKPLVIDKTPAFHSRFFARSFTIFSSTLFLFLKFGTLLADQNYRFLSEETSHNLSPRRWGRGGSEDFQGITWFSGGTVAADHSSPAEYWMPINWKWKVTIRMLQL